APGTTQTYAEATQKRNDQGGSVATSNPFVSLGEPEDDEDDGEQQLPPNSAAHPPAVMKRTDDSEEEGESDKSDSESLAADLLASRRAAKPGHLNSRALESVCVEAFRQALHDKTEPPAWAMKLALPDPESNAASLS
ncbi:unnamed protein product, partial [Pylaiella littoralis]